MCLLSIYMQFLFNSFYLRCTLFDCILLILKFPCMYFMAQGPVEDQSLTEQATLYKDLK